MVAPKVFVATVPKSGTHLLDSILRLIPPMRRQQKVALNAKLRFHPFNWLPFTGSDKCLTGIGRPHEVKVSAMRHALGRIRAGRYAMGYVPHQQVVMRLLEELDIRTVVVVRDPRDVVVSLMHHSRSKPRHFMHDHLLALPDDQSRLRFIIDGGCNDRGEELASIAQQMDFIVGWVEDPRVLTLRFEELIGSRGGGADDVQRRAILRLAAWLGLALDDAGAASVGERMFGTGKTFRKGRIAGWRDAFDDALAQHFAACMGDRLARLGYD